MSERKIRSWELIEEEDGSTSLDVEYADGGTATFTNVKLESISESLPAGVQSIPLTFTVVK